MGLSLTLDGGVTDVLRCHSISFPSQATSTEACALS